MKRWLSAVTVVAAATVAATSGSSSAGGLALDVSSGRATGMALAMTGHVNDASGIFFNPAGIAQGKGLDVRVGATLIAPHFKVTPVGGAPQSPRVDLVPLPHIYAAYGITDQITVGLGFFIPYGLALHYPQDFAGRSVISDASFRSYVFNPTVAFRDDWVRLAAGLQVARGTVELSRDLALPGGQTGSIDVGGGDWGIGGNLGLQISAIPEMLTFGAFYRSTFSLGINGRADFSGVNDPALQTTLRDQPATARFVLPDQLGAGVAYRPISKLLVDFDLVYFGWQRFRDLTIQFPEDPALLDRQPKQWHHGFQYRLGAEYALDPKWQIRAGLIYDESPAPRQTLSPDVPDSDRFNIAAGGSFLFGKSQVDLGYQLIIFTGRNSLYPPLPAHYSGTAHVLSLTYGIRI